MITPHSAVRRFLPALVAMLSLGVLVASANAQTIYSNLGPSPGFTNGTTYAISGPATNNGSVTQGFEFTASATAPFESADAALVLLGGTNAITFSLYSDSGANTLGTLLDTTPLVNAVPNSTALVPIPSTLHPTLTAGANYWLVGAVTGDTFISWQGDNSNTTGLEYALVPPFPAFYLPTAPAPVGAFDILGPATTPEPGSLTLLTSGGFGALGFLAKKRREAGRAA